MWGVAEGIFTGVREGEAVFLCLGLALVVGVSSASKTSDFLLLDPAAFETAFVG